MKKRVSICMILCFLLLFENKYLGSCEAVEKQDNFVEAMSEIYVSDDLDTCDLDLTYLQAALWEGQVSIVGTFEAEDYTIDLCADCAPDGQTIDVLSASLSSPYEQAWDVYEFIQQNMKSALGRTYESLSFFDSTEHTSAIGLDRDQVLEFMQGGYPIESCLFWQWPESHGYQWVFCAYHEGKGRIAFFIDRSRVE